MKKSSGLIFGLLVVFAFEACTTSNVTTKVSTTIPTTETAFLASTLTRLPVPTVDPLTPSAIAGFFQTLEAPTSTPGQTSTANYRDCSGNMFFMSKGSWGLCHGLRDPITIINQSNQKWEFSYKEYYGRNVPNPCTRLRYLSNDENYLYFSLDAECELIEPGFVLTISLFRMNLSNGDVKEILKADYDFDSYDGNQYTISISPTGRRLAYIADQSHPLKLNLLDLNTGELKSFPLEERYILGGAYAWSEDGTKLVFTLASEKDNEHFISMVFLDTLKEDSMVTFIKDKEFRWVSSQIEVTNNGIKIDPYFDEPLFYNIETGILGPAGQ
jgi:hypothetical protein